MGPWRVRLLGRRHGRSSIPHVEKVPLRNRKAADHVQRCMTIVVLSAKLLVINLVQ